MEFGKRHDTTDITDFCPRQLVTDLLLTCYGETGVMDFGLYGVCRKQTRLKMGVEFARPENGRPRKNKD